MIEELEERLQETYKLDIKITKDEFGFIYINFGNIFEIPFIYQRNMTLEVNYRNAKAKIDKEIIKMYKKEKNDDFS